MKDNSKSMYFRREAVPKATSILKSAPHYKDVLEFLKAVDRIAPNVGLELAKLERLYLYAGAFIHSSSHTLVFEEALDTESMFPGLSEEAKYLLNAETENSFSMWAQVKNSDEPVVLKLCLALVDWANKWHLTTPTGLYLDIALRALENHILNGGTADTPVSLAGGLLLDKELEANTVSDNYPFAFTPDAGRLTELSADPGFYEGVLNSREPWHGVTWDPRKESWSDFKRSMENAFQSYLEGYKERILQSMGGYDNVNPKRELIHFEWLVWYQILGYRWSEIAGHKRYEAIKSADEGNIRKNARNTAERVLLKLR